MTNTTTLTSTPLANLRGAPDCNTNLVNTLVQHLLVHFSISHVGPDPSRPQPYRNPNPSSNPLAGLEVGRSGHVAPPRVSVVLFLKVGLDQSKSGIARVFLQGGAATTAGPLRTYVGGT